MKPVQVFYKLVLQWTTRSSDKAPQTQPRDPPRETLSCDLIGVDVTGLYYIIGYNKAVSNECFDTYCSSV